MSISFNLTDAEWLQVVTASAYTVLTKRDDALPKAKRLTVDVCKGGMEAVASARESQDRLAFLQHIRECVVSSTESEKCFDAATASCQDEWIPHTTADAGSCCISGLKTDLLQVTLFGNKGPGRTESAHVVNVEWQSFVRAVMIVGSLHELLDQLITPLLDQQRTIDQDKLENLATKQLDNVKKSINRASAFLSKSIA